MKYLIDIIQEQNRLLALAAERIDELTAENKGLRKPVFKAPTPKCEREVFVEKKIMPLLSGRSITEALLLVECARQACFDRYIMQEILKHRKAA